MNQFQARKNIEFFGIIVGVVLFCWSAWGQTTCKEYGKPQKTGQFANDKVDESSGIAASRRNPGVWWTHNDSGGKPRVYAFDETGKHLGRFQVEGAAHVDWEDMAAAPCPDGSPCLYIGDVGDNLKRRKEIRIYRVKEPKVEGDPDEKKKTEVAEVFRLKYPDGSHNCETVLVHPKTRDIFVITKESRKARVYRLPGTTAPSSEVLTLEKMSDLTLPGDTLTGGDFSPFGDQIVLRTYTFALLYAPGADGVPKDENQLSRLKIAITIQGESIGYSTDGRSILTTTERLPAPIFKVSCTQEPKPEPQPEPQPEPEPELTQEPISEPSREKPTTPDASDPSPDGEENPESTNESERVADDEPEEGTRVGGVCGCTQGPENSLSWSLLLLVFVAFSNRNNRSCL